MALLKTFNPALSVNTFRFPQAALGESMTISGAVNKTGILLICAVLTAAWSWNRFTVAPETAGLPLMIGLIGGLVVALVTVFQERVVANHSTALPPAGRPGTGSVSAMYEARFRGLPFRQWD
jgi:uncharacterized YccA/Bax inhibitor family protein